MTEAFITVAGLLTVMLVIVFGKYPVSYLHATTNQMIYDSGNLMVVLVSVGKYSVSWLVGGYEIQLYNN